MEARAETIVKADMLAMLDDQNVEEDTTAATIAFSLLKTANMMASL